MKLTNNFVYQANTYCTEEQRTILSNIFNELDFSGGLTVFRVMEKYIKCQMMFDKVNSTIGHDMIQEIGIMARQYYNSLKKGEQNELNETQAISQSKKTDK